MNGRYSQGSLSFGAMTLRVGEISLQPGAGLRGAIDFSVELRYTGERVVILDANLRVNVQIPGRGLVPVGTATWENSQGPLEFGRSDDHHFSFHLAVAPWQLQILEDNRGRVPLELQLQPTLIGIILDNTNMLPAYRETTYRNITVDKARWVEQFLPAFGLGTHELWEMRFPLPKNSGRLTVESRLLDRAVEDYNRGDYEDAYNDARQMVESLKNRAAELDLEMIVGPQEWKRAMSYLSIALHAENEIPRRVVRADAEFALTLARAVHQRVAHAVQNQDEKK